MVLNKNKLYSRMAFCFFLFVAMICAVFIVNIESDQFYKNQTAVFYQALENLDPDNLYLSGAIVIETSDQTNEVEFSYLYKDNYIIERQISDDLNIARKYMDGEVYTYMDQVWYKENSNKIDTPQKLNISVEDFETVKSTENLFTYRSDAGNNEYICKVKEESKEKYIPADILELIGDESLYLELRCDSSNSSIENVSFTYNDEDLIIMFSENLSSVNDDIMLSRPEYSVDVEVIEDAYDINPVESNEDSIELYDNYGTLLGNVTVPAGFQYDENISTRSEIYMSENEGYGEIIVKGKCDAIIERMLQNGEYSYEENSSVYNLEYMFSITAKSGNVDIYSYVEERDEFGAVSYYIGITTMNNQIVELMFVDTKLDFSQEAIENFVNYIL